MKASASSSDRGNAGASLNFDELFSVLMYYAHMSKSDIMNSSRRFLFAIYRNYVKRACENLGVASEGEDEDSLSEEEYPSEFKTFSQKEREEYVSESGMSDAEFMAQFPVMKH